MQAPMLILYTLLLVHASRTVPLAISFGARVRDDIKILDFDCRMPSK